MVKPEELQLLFDVNNGVYAFRTKPLWSLNTWYITKKLDHNGHPFLLMINTPYRVARHIAQSKHHVSDWTKFNDFSTDSDWADVFEYAWCIQPRHLDFEMTDELSPKFWNYGDMATLTVGYFNVKGQPECTPWTMDTPSLIKP